MKELADIALANERERAERQDDESRLLDVTSAADAIRRRGVESLYANRQKWRPDQAEPWARRIRDAAAFIAAELDKVLGDRLGADES